MKYLKKYVIQTIRKFFVLLQIGLLVGCTSGGSEPANFYISNKDDMDHLAVTIRSFERIYSCRKINNNAYVLHMQNETTEYFVNKDSLNILFLQNEKMAHAADNLKFFNLLESYLKVDQDILFQFKGTAYMYVYSKSVDNTVIKRKKDSVLEFFSINCNWYAYRRKLGLY
ncbi:hypothetical protein QNI16_36520 [Cytophagaceae bacterium YF14B1]|uniref:Lipoprotein n=1 Tax=Xanthocytophaga flava TaxID=3048013 RepID=A0AAE3UAE6_9BACT|nr:hypothetical protein [Xanthocytophaga flavus]MDJ1486044.1 hypothetical protein [Xanthocytophaga flavus]